MTAVSAPEPKKSLENRLLAALVAISVVVGLGVFAYSRGLYYYVQFFWDDLFADVHRFGDDCEVGIGAWVDGDPVSGILAQPPATRRLPMPYFAADPGEKPDVGPGQYLFTRCRVDLSVLQKDGFAWMRLHSVHGETSIFLNGNLKQTLGDLGVAEFPISPSERVAGSTVVLVSRPNSLKTKLLGLPTSMPLIFTDSREALAKPNVGATFDRTLRPAYLVNETLIFLLIFAVAWLGGIRREDIAWLVVAMACNAALATAMFSKANALGPTARAMLPAFGFATNVAMACFAWSFTGIKVRRVKPIALFLVSIGIYTPLCFLPRGTISSVVLFNYVPMAVQCALYIMVALLCFRRRQASQAFDYPRRLTFVAWFCAGLAGARILDLMIYRQVGFTFAEVISEAGFTGFSVFLIFDLVVNYRRYLAEKVLRLETEARSREFEAVARVTQMLAHDVRKPYQTLMNGLKLLEAELGQGTSVPMTNRIRAEVERALGETNAMLSDVMDIGARKSESAGEVTVSEVADLCLERAIEMNQKSSLKVARDWRGPMKLAVDPRRFQRVLMNLIENAVQATPPAGTLKLSSESVEFEGRTFARLTIWNSGSYIPEVDRAKIFEPFFTKNKSKGTGLGLAIVKKFVEGEGGRIECRSEMGEGTSFVIDLPLFESKAPGVLALIDDDVFVREIWQSIGGGWTVKVFDGPAEFWRVAGEDRRGFAEGFDVIMTDYYFSSDDEGTGAEFAAAFRAMGADVPVVLFSDVRLEDAEKDVFDGQVAKGEEARSEVVERFSRVRLK